ncbi:TPA: hypothetical protein ACOEPM_000309 [Stenotrophomonas maltophilia]
MSEKENFAAMVEISQEKFSEMFPKVVECPKCHGHGGDRWHNPDGSEWGERCDRCDGFGYIGKGESRA